MQVLSHSCPFPLLFHFPFPFAFPFSFTFLFLSRSRLRLFLHSVPFGWLVCAFSQKFTWSVDYLLDQMGSAFKGIYIRTKYSYKEKFLKTRETRRFCQIAVPFPSFSISLFLLCSLFPSLSLSVSFPVCGCFCFYIRFALVDSCWFSIKSFIEVLIFSQFQGFNL